PFEQRLLRSQTLKMEMIQQPKTVNVYDPTSQSNLPGRNLDSWLFKASITGDPSQWFATPSDVQAQASNLVSAAVDISSDTNGEALCSKFVGVHSPGIDKNKNQFQKCLLRLGADNVLKRIIGASKGTFSWTQNPHIFNGIVVPPTYNLDNRTFAGEADYD